MKSARPPTSFESSVYAACRAIPAGKVATYADLGRAIGCGSARAVGQALRRNPFAPQTPCHRVVASDLRLGGFNGNADGPDVARKARMLRAEGVRIENGRVAPDCHHRFGPGA